MKFTLNLTNIMKVIQTKENELSSHLLFEPIGEGVNIGLDGNEDDTSIEESCCKFRENDELTLLGFINGILPELTGQVLVAKLDEETKEILGWCIKDKW